MNLKFQSIFGTNHLLEFIHYLLRNDLLSPVFQSLNFLVGSFFRYCFMDFLGFWCVRFFAVVSFVAIFVRCFSLRSHFFFYRCHSFVIIFGIVVTAIVIIVVFVHVVVFLVTSLNVLLLCSVVFYCTQALLVVNRISVEFKNCFVVVWS